MPGRGDIGAPGRAVVYCVIPWALAEKLHEPLRRHFASQTGIEVVVERRASERRTAPDRRAEANATAAEKRRIKAASGRRVAERRASVVEAEPPQLPRRLARHAEQIVFVERLEPSTQHKEDLDTVRLVTRAQAGDPDAFAALYMRYFDRVYSYLRLVLKTPHDAEDATQHIFTQVYAALPRYERRGQPFRAWLFTIVRNHAVDVLRKRNRVEIEEPEQVANRRESTRESEGLDLSSLEWLTDRELVMFIQRLPLAQRQVLLLRFMLDMKVSEIAEILGRTPNDISALQHRALAFLRERLTAVGQGGGERTRAPMQRWVRPARVLRRRRYALMP